MSRKSYGSFSLLLPRRPGLVEDRREDKTNTSFFWPHFLDHPSSTPNRSECVSFLFYLFFFLFTSLLLSSAGLISGRGHWDKGRRYISAFFFFSLPFQEFGKIHTGRKGLAQDSIAAATQHTRLETRGTRQAGNTQSLPSLSLSLMRFTFLLSSNDTLADDRHGWVGKGHGPCTFGACFFLRRRSRQSHTHDTLFCVVLL